MLQAKPGRRGTKLIKPGDRLLAEPCRLLTLLVPDHRGFRVQRDEVLLRQRAGLSHRRPLPHPPHMAIGHQAQLSLREGPTEGRYQNFA